MATRDATAEETKPLLGSLTMDPVASPPSPAKQARRRSSLPGRAVGCVRFSPLTDPDDQAQRRASARGRSRSLGARPRNYDSGVLALSGDDEEEVSRFWFPSMTSWFAELNKLHAATVLILFFVNLINYMDRSVVAGMIDSIKNDRAFHQPSDKNLGLLQTVFVIFYMLFAPVFGYLGDRHSRKLILCFGLSVWCAATFAGSFAGNYWLFVFFRAVVGIGEASYSTLAPAIISDLFCNDSRSRVLALFYFAIPLGIGLGYIIGSQVAYSFGDWRWGLRVTPFMGLLSVLLIIFFMKDPRRGESDGTNLRPTSPMADVRALLKNRSFILATLGFTCVTFSVGAMMWWGPAFAYYGAKAMCGNKAGCESITPNVISYRFGIVMAFAGLFGVPLGSYAAQLIRHKLPNADPLVCGFTLLLSVPVMYFGFISARFSTETCYGLTFLAGLLLNCNWSVVSDMTLYLVIPTRRSFASATQILMSHFLGDAISPYLVGAVADAIRASIWPNTPSFQDNLMDEDPHSPKYFDAEFRSLQYSLFMCCFFQAIGSLFFLATSWFVVSDKRLADAAMMLDDEEENRQQQHGSENTVGPV